MQKETRFALSATIWKSNAYCNITNAIRHGSDFDQDDSDHSAHLAEKQGMI